MSIQLFNNNASSLLASGINNLVTSLAVTPTQGALFPSPAAGQVATITVEDVSGNIEYMTCTARTGDTLTVVRGAEGSTPLTFSSGSRVEQRVTAGMLSIMLQKAGGDTLSGTTSVSGIISLGAGGSITGGEYAGGFLRQAAGDTAGQIFVSGGQPKSGSSTILTSSNVTTNLPAGTALILQNMVVMWAGSSGAIPSGWHLCDGTTGTPDLRDSFIVGGGGALPAGPTSYVNPTGSTTPAGGTTGGYVHTLADLPSHVHPFDYFFGNVSAVVVVPGGSAAANFITGSGGAGVRNSFAGTPNTGFGSNAHTHSYAGVAHTHPQAIPYRGVFMIMKL